MGARFKVIRRWAVRNQLLENMSGVEKIFANSLSSADWNNSSTETASVSSRYPGRRQRLGTAFSRARSAAELKPDQAGEQYVCQPGNHRGSGDVAE